MDQQGLASIALSTAVAAIGFTLMGFFVGWAWIFVRWNNQQPILEFEPRRPVPWTIVSLVLAIVGFIALASVVALVFRTMAVPLPVAEVQAVAGSEPSAVEAAPAEGVATKAVASNDEADPAPPSNAPANAKASAPSNRPLVPIQAKRPFPTVSIWLDTSIKLLFVVFALAALLASGATPRDLGISLAHWKRDLTAGVLGFCTIAPLILMLQAVLVKWWQPSAHPLIESLRANLTLECWLAVTLAAVFGAPLFEEFAFRVLFQGWIEGVCDSTARPIMLDLRNPLPAENQAAVPSTNPYAPPNPIDLPPPPPPVTELELRTPIGDMFPIVVSSLVFALMHYGHGPDWVTLIPFAGMLGFLYRRTHRIWPSVVAHLMLNGFSMTMLTVSLFWPAAFQKA